MKSKGRGGRIVYDALSAARPGALVDAVVVLFDDESTLEVEELVLDAAESPCAEEESACEESAERSAPELERASL